MRVVGTAGHVDHGKSALVEALTGINPDRLKEEQEREMTIDLGFAWLSLPSGQSVSIVDVPGHEDFIKNMLAGVGGIDAALLVVAADEGVMPQTREHLAILDLLRVQSGIVALTKVDLIDDPEWLDLVETDVAELLEGTCLESAPVIPVSARTGQGLDVLLAELDKLLATTSPRRDLGRPRLPIDRAFTIAGFGTVVTGTLIDGHLKVGQEVEIVPQGLRSRIRGLQTHKHKIETAVPGSRVAANLIGLHPDQLHRGDVVTIPGWLTPTLLMDVRAQVLRSSAPVPGTGAGALPDAPRPLRHNVEVEVFTGATQVLARARVLGAKEIAPGETGWVQLALARPIPVVKNDRFILRQPSPSLTIGGGVVVDPHPGRRHRRFRPEVIARLEKLMHGSPDEVLLETLQREEPCDAETLMRRSNLPRDEARQALEGMAASGQVLALDAPPGETRPITRSQSLVSAAGWATLAERMVQAVSEYHRQYPLRAGMPREELKSRLRLAPRRFNEMIAQAVREGRLSETETAVRLPGHQVRFTPEQQARVDRLLQAFAREPYTPPSLSEAEAQVGAEVLNALLEQGRLVKTSEDVAFLAEAYDEMVNRVIAHIKEHGSITVAQVRDMFGASRKYALALMEHLDDRRVTRRVGDERVLR